MFDPAQIDQVKDLLARSQTVLVIFSQAAKPDMIASAASLFLGLSTLEGKSVTLLSPEPVGSKLQHLAGLNQIQTQLGNKNLQVSFPYTPEQVDKVNYHLDEAEERFYLMIQPLKGHKALDYKQVEFAMVGAEADLIFVVGVSQLENLDQLYIGYESVYEDATVVTLNNFEPGFGRIKLNSSGAASVCEATYKLLLDLQLPITGEIATNLLWGVEDQTDGLQSLTATADTFQVVAELMRLGARRVRHKSESPLLSPQKTPRVKQKTSSGKPFKAGELSFQPSKDMAAK